jgi:hypothetical protein
MPITVKDLYKPHPVNEKNRERGIKRAPNEEMT